MSEIAYEIVARQVLPRYGLPADADLKLLASGHNHVFRVDHGAQRWVLRFQSDERLSDAAQLLQLEWLDSIRSKANLCVPCPVRTLAGEWFTRATIAPDPPPRRCVLLKWVAGDQLSPPRAFVTRDILEAVGETVARLHEQSLTFRSVNYDAANQIDAEHLVGGFSCMGNGRAAGLFANSDYAALTAAAEKIADAMAIVRKLEGQYGLIHADLAPANWVFHNGEPRPIDFDEFGRGFFLYDLLGVLWSHVSWDEYPQFKEHLLRGYERVRPLAPEVMQQADTFQAATLFAWLNHGCRLTDEAAKAEFLKWVPSTTRSIARLCDI